MEMEAVLEQIDPRRQLHNAAHAEACLDCVPSIWYVNRYRRVHAIKDIKLLTL